MKFTGFDRRMAKTLTIRRIRAAVACARLSDGSRRHTIAVGGHGGYWHCKIRPSEEIIAGNKTSKGYSEREMDSAWNSK